MRRAVLLLSVWALCAAASAVGQSVSRAAVQTAEASDNVQSLILEATDSNLRPSERYRVEPQRVEQGPRLDGHLDEEVWVTAPVIEDFVQQEPAEGEPATERTIVRIIYDARALYIGVQALDS